MEKKFTTVFLVFIIFFVGCFLYINNYDSNKDNKDDKKETKEDVKEKTVYDIIIETDYKWLTMQNDGGSNTNIYYQIDSKNNKVIKCSDDYHANLGGTPETIHKIVYEKEIDSNTIDAILNIYNNSSDKNDTYMHYTINNVSIYDTDLINDLKDILNYIDQK